MTPSRMLPPLAAVMVLGAGCGSSAPALDRGQLQDRVSALLPQQGGTGTEEVSCPDDLVGTVGETMRCTVTRRSDKVPVDVRVTGVDGDRIRFQVQPTVLRPALERQVSAALEREVGRAPDDIACPDDLVGTVGEKMRCTLTAGTDRLGLTVEVSSVKGTQVHFDVTVDDAGQEEG